MASKASEQYRPTVTEPTLKLVNGERGHNGDTGGLHGVYWWRRRQKTSWLILDQQGELVFKGGGVNPLCRLQARWSRLLGVLAEARLVRH
jgi:hypothetical protein